MKHDNCILVYKGLHHTHAVLNLFLRHRLTTSAVATDSSSDEGLTWSYLQVSFSVSGCGEVALSTHGI